MKKSRAIALPLLLGISTVLVLIFAVQTQAPAVESAPAVNCSVSYDKTASPAEVDAGGVVTVSLTLQAVGNCSAANSPVDVLLVIDRSGSMSGQKIADAKQAAVSFVNQMDLSVDQVGVASFSSHSWGRLDHQLSQDATATQAAINGLYAYGMTDIKEGLEIAETELLSSRHLAGNAPVIILLSDGHHNESPTGDLLAAANRIKGEGFRIISIGLGNYVDEGQLKAIASSNNDYYYAPASSDLTSIYHSIVGTVRVSARNMRITDTLGSAVTLLSGSFQGPISPTVSGNQIIWQVAAVPTSTLTLNYQVAMTDTAGTWPTNDSALATYIDADGNAASLTFPVPTVKVRQQWGQPVLNDVQPTWTCQNTVTPMNLFGGGFFQPGAFIGSQALTVLAYSGQTISATLASGLSAGTYDATVANQHTLSDTLVNAFTVYPMPNIIEVRPAEGYNDIPVELTICGQDGFAPGSVASLELLTGTVTLENQHPVGNSCLIGTMPAGPSTWAGEHKVSVQNACGVTTDSTSGKYRILPADLNDDLWGRSQELWVDPSVASHLNEDIKIGQIVHRRGGKSPLQDVTVRFYEGDPNGTAAVQIGDGTIPLLPPRVNPAERISGTSTSEVGWVPSQGAGQYTLYAVIDPDSAVQEDIETNNVVSRTVQILPPVTSGLDGVAPHVDQFSVSGGADTVYDANVPLHVEATDFVQQNGTLSGLANMYFVEFLFNQAAGVWTPVQTSGWISYTEDSTWSLVTQGGLRYMQAWASDAAGNISRYPYQQWTNYIRPCERVSRNGTRTYSQDVKQGDILEVEVIPCSGDPDLYIWPPDWQSGSPAWVSNQYGTATEYISITAPVDGVYQVEVYGYTTAEYNLQMEVQPALTTTLGSFAASAAAPAIVHASDKTKLTAPAVPADSAPQTLMGVPPAPVSVTTPQFNVYLPLILR